MRPLIALIAAVCIYIPSLHAAETEKPSVEDVVAEKIRSGIKKNYLSFSLENDSLGGGSDKWYTSGARLTWFNVNSDVPPVIEDIAETIPTFDINETTSTFFTIGQSFFTPEDITIAAQQPNDRPWAGWLYGSVGLSTLTDNHIDEVEVTLGIVGPEALAEPTQKFVHRNITNSPKPRGWDHQLDFEPGLILSWQRRWPYALDINIGDYKFRAEPSINLSAGNVYTFAGTGLMFMFGPDFGYLQDTPPRIHPGMPGSGFFETTHKNLNWFLFAGMNGRAVARNIFLDGNTFTHGPSVDKKPLVGDASAGLGITLGDYRLSYAINMRTKEFDGQNSDGVFGSVTLTSRF